MVEERTAARRSYILCRKKMPPPIATKMLSSADVTNKITIGDLATRREMFRFSTSDTENMLIFIFRVSLVVTAHACRTIDELWATTVHLCYYYL